MAKYFKYFTHLFFIYYLLFSTALLTSSCQEGGEAGDLFGQWRMEGSDAKYMSFSGRVSLFRTFKDGELHEIYGNFQHQGDSLFIQCVSTKGAPIDTVIVETDYGFTPFTDIRTKVVTLDSDRLIVSKGKNTWTFYKY